MGDWFEKMLGFAERSPGQLHERLTLEGTRVRSPVNGEGYECGRLEIATLQELRQRAGEAILQF